MRKRYTGFNNGGNMLNINEPKINEVVQNIHEAMVRKSKRGGKSSEEIITESRIFSIICSDFDLGPAKVAGLMNSEYGYDMTSDEVIQIFRSRKMANPNERKELFKWADNVARLFKGAMLGKKEKFEKLESLRKEPALKSGKKHDSQDRIAAIMIYERYPEIDIFDDRNSLYLLGNTVAKYFFYDMVDAVRDVYFFNQNNDENKQEQSEKKNKLSYEQAIRRVEQLEGTLERTNTMLQDLQDEFGLTYVFIAHDLAVIQYISTRVAVMYLGRIVEIGHVDQVFDNPIHPYTKALLSAIPVPDPEVEAKRQRIMLDGDLPTPVNAPVGCGFSSRCPIFKLLPEDKQKRCLEEKPEVITLDGEDHGYACYYPDGADLPDVALESVS